MVLLGEEAQVEAHFGPLEMMIILTQDGCTVGAERTIGSKKSFWTHSMELLGDVGRVESCFFPFGVSVSVGAR